MNNAGGQTPDNVYSGWMIKSPPERQGAWRLFRPVSMPLYGSLHDNNILTTLLAVITHQDLQVVVLKIAQSWLITDVIWMPGCWIQKCKMDHR